MLTVNAYAAPSATQPLVPMTLTRRDLGPHDVLIEIKFCGICHSDIHSARDEWGGAAYPLVPGHEIAGLVAQVGTQVTRHAVGDRVGVGCMVDACRECDNCREGEEQHCLDMRFWGSAMRMPHVQGGFRGRLVAAAGERIARASRGARDRAAGQRALLVLEDGGRLAARRATRAGG